MKSFYPKKKQISHSWHLINAEDIILGKLAVETSKLLMGKHKSSFTPGVDSGDFVIVVNSSKVSVTGNKASQKIYHKHTGYPGGIKSTSFEQMKKRNKKLEIADRSYKNEIQELMKESAKKESIIVNMKRDFHTYNRIYAEYFKDNLPCRTTCEISSLPTPIAIELKCIATID